MSGFKPLRKLYPPNNEAKHTKQLLCQQNSDVSLLLSVFLLPRKLYLLLIDCNVVDVGLCIYTVNFSVMRGDSINPCSIVVKGCGLMCLEDYPQVVLLC